MTDPNTLSKTLKISRIQKIEDVAPEKKVGDMRTEIIYLRSSTIEFSFASPVNTLAFA